MFKNLLIPLDGTTDAAVALPAARTLARATAGELTLLRVVPPRSLGADTPALEDARTYLAAIAAELAKGGIVAHTVVRQGTSAADEIVRDAVTGGADLIVMATHGRGGLQRALVGSAAQGVLAHSSVPVMLLRPGGHRMNHLHTLLVPVDGSPGASLALSVAVPLAQATGARLVLVQVVIPGLQYYPEGPLRVDVDLDEDRLASAQQYAAGLARRIERAHVAAEGRTVLGRAWEEIVQAADAVGADLIVMSTHALTGPARTLLGSVADEVVRAADQPVLLVRQRHGARAPSGGEPRSTFIL